MEIQQKKQNMKSKMWDILVDISWSQISMKYFGKSRSWLSQKMIGLDGNSSETEFTASEKEILKNALQDLAKRIDNCAKSI